MSWVQNDILMKIAIISIITSLMVGCDNPTRRLRGTWIMDPVRTLELNDGMGLTPEEVDFFTTNLAYRTFRKHEFVDTGIFSPITSSYEIVGFDSTSISARCYAHVDCDIPPDRLPPLIRFVFLDDNTHYIDGPIKPKECYIRKTDHVYTE